MEDRFYYRELECYEKAGEALLRVIGKNDYFDLSLLGTETMKEEFRRYIRYRGTQVSLNTIQHEKSCFCNSARHFRHAGISRKACWTGKKIGGSSC